MNSQLSSCTERGHTNINYMVIKYLLLIVLLAASLPRQRFPAGVNDLVDKRWLITIDNMVNTRKKDTEKTKRYSAKGTGKQSLKILYQNGGNVDDTFGMFKDIETMLNTNRPHCFFMAENRIDMPTKSRLENRHGYCVESLGGRERVWGAVKATVPYKRRKDLEQPGIAALWL